MRLRLLSLSQNLPRAFEIRGRVDAERHAGDDGRVDAHAGFERAQLLKLLALLERRGRECDETREGGAAKGIKADMVIERALARRGGGAGEIKRAQSPLANRRAHELHHVR